MSSVSRLVDQVQTPELVSNHSPRPHFLSDSETWFYPLKLRVLFTENRNRGSGNPKQAHLDVRVSRKA